MPNITPAVFLLILRYIYTGVLDLTNQSGFNILALLVAADELIPNKLVNYIQHHLINEESSWLQKHLVIILHTVFKLQSCKTIQDHIMKTICKNPKSFFELKDFLTLDKDIYLKLVMRNDMDIEEIDTWKYLVKLGTEQSVTSKGKSKDVINWGENDFASFKKFLDPFIPYIRFHEISRNDFYFHIRPYKKAIPEDLYEDLVTYLMANITPKVSKLPSRYGSINIDSMIIEKDKAAIITNWIEKRTNFARKPVYQFKLTYRASRDGFNYENFIHNNSNGAILWLIKISDSENIIGGYNPLGLRNMNYNYNYKNYNVDCMYEFGCDEFNHYCDGYGNDCDYNGNYYGNNYEQWETTNDSFIFCFEDVKSSNNYALSRVKNPSTAIYSYDGNWMNFGNADLILNGQNGSCTQCHYEKNLNVNNFVVEELETFVVQKT
ncbi:20034_t:CDS:2 [Cetraspora pellucida]|uniref:20034_t:CDS:1 n=1 Tax=Cetraspora pellucida TaxID=1433469 RepID=A0A9N9D7X0_9GLOM|nr:20034_t:CDS:2 [Cetraspora pellucida]